MPELSFTPFGINGDSREDKAKESFVPFGIEEIPERTSESWCSRLTELKEVHDRDS